MDTIERVRRAFYVHGWSVKKIVRELHVSRNTVRKILRSDKTDFSYERSRQPLPWIEPWQLEHFLSSNGSKASRKRLTLIRIFEKLRALGYEGEDAPPPVKWSAVMIRKRRIENGKQASEAGRDCVEATAG